MGTRAAVHRRADLPHSAGAVLTQAIRSSLVPLSFLPPIARFAYWHGSGRTSLPPALAHPTCPGLPSPNHPTIYLARQTVIPRHTGPPYPETPTRDSCPL